MKMMLLLKMNMSHDEDKDAKLNVQMSMLVCGAIFSLAISRPLPSE